MKDKQDRKPPRQRPRPSALARLIPMVGLFQSGLADWRAASDGTEEGSRPSALARQIPMVGLLQSGLADWRSASKGPGKEQAAAGEEEKGGK